MNRVCPHVSAVCVAAVSILTVSSSEGAERWQTASGFLSVEKPNEDSYEPARPISPPQLARWRSPNGSMEFAVELVPPLPEGTPSLKQIERAYSTKDTTVTRRPSRKSGKHDIWIIETLNTDVKQLIAIVHHDEWFHRLRVTGLAAAFDMNSAEAFVKSITIKAGKWEPPSRSLKRK
ncbi:MAG: hypothetical protein AAGD07_03790 [Planctomycetota bacterium]